MTHLEITHTHTYIYIYIDTHIDIQFTFGNFKDIEEMKNFTRDTKFYKQTKKKKKIARHSYFSLLEIHYNIKAVRGRGLFSAIWVCVYIYIL